MHRIGSATCCWAELRSFSDFNRQLFGRLGHQYPNRSDLRRIHRYMSETNDKPPSHPQVLCVEAFSALRKRFRWSDPEPAGSLFLNHVECPITIVEVFPLCAFKSQVKRRRGGIEPLHVSMPLELKSSPSTSPTHPGRCCQLLRRTLVHLKVDVDSTLACTKLPHKQTQQPESATKPTPPR